MLLPYTTLTYYGPGAAAMGVVSGDGSFQGTPRQSKAISVSVTGVGSAALLRPYRGRQAGMSGAGVGTLYGEPKKSIRSALTVKVNDLTQDDVTSAVLGGIVEGDLTLQGTMRLLLAYIAGDASDLSGNPQFKSIDGSVTRLAGTIVDGERTITTRETA